MHQNVRQQEEFFLVASRRGITFAYVQPRRIVEIKRQISYVPRLIRIPFTTVSRSDFRFAVYREISLTNYKYARPRYVTRVTDLSVIVIALIRCRVSIIARARASSQPMRTIRDAFYYKHPAHPEVARLRFEIPNEIQTCPRDG